MLSQLISVGIAKLEVSSLRKLTEPPAEWTNRLGDDAPWRRMLEALRNEPKMSRSPSSFAFFEPWARGWRGVVGHIEGIPPCELSKLSEKEAWRPMEEELRKSTPLGEDPEQMAEVFRETSMPNLTQALRRAARLLVDRELTLRILEPRMERAASRYGRWPERLLDSESRVCPGVSYEYRRRGGAMEIRFGGSMDDPSPGLVLPLAYRAGSPRRAPARSAKTRPVGP